MPSESSLLRASRPVLEVDGTENGPLAEGLLSLAIRETTEGLHRCEAVFGNWGPRQGRTDFLYFDRQEVDFGHAFVVKVADDVIFRGRVTALEARFGEGRAPELAVLAEDRLQDLRMTRRTRTFANVTDADLVRQIAGDHGLQADVNLDGPSHEVLAQVNQSDLAFLRDRVRSLGGEVWVDDTTLGVARRPDRPGERLELTYGNEVREFTVIADLAGQRTEVVAGGWDVSGKQALNETASDSVLASETAGGKSGATVLREAFGARRETLVHGAPATAAEARELASAYFRTIARRFVVGRGVAATQADLRVGATVDLTGLGPLFSGAYYVSEVCHRFDGAKGLRTEFTAERPWLGRP